jgi:hypothetical protein
MTTILLAGMLGFLIILAIVLTLMRSAIKRDAFTSDGWEDQPVLSSTEPGRRRHGQSGVRRRLSRFGKVSPRGHQWRTRQQG